MADFILRAGDRLRKITSRESVCGVHRWPHRGIVLVEVVILEGHG